MRRTRPRTRVFLIRGAYGELWASASDMYPSVGAVTPRIRLMVMYKRGKTVEQTIIHFATGKDACRVGDLDVIVYTQVGRRRLKVPPTYWQTLR